MGTNDRGNKRAGHVPNAQHLEWVRFVGTDDYRRFLPADKLQPLVDDAGITRDRPIITYCQGGVRAAHAAFMLSLLGYEGVRVYDGSMREWANRDDTPLVSDPRRTKKPPGESGRLLQGAGRSNYSTGAVGSFSVRSNFSSASSVKPRSARSQSDPQSVILRVVLGDLRQS